ncbi:MAG: hypothetical protein IJ733_15125 [Lachnospiraceae bacterium]|nr:hypothetical protein [Lachnospiraceae bacterium]
MLEKIVNSMLHGNLKTKIFLWAIFLFGIGALALFVTAFALGMPMLGAGGVGLALLALILSQSISLNDLARKRKAKEKRNRNKEKREKNHAEKDALNNGEAGEKSVEKEVTDEVSRRKKEREKAQFLASMNEKKMKKLLKEHKVNQIHVKVMIDSFPKGNIEQAPAFMWKTDKMLHFLVLTGNAQEFEVPLADIQGILLVKNVPADPDTDYMPFKVSNFITKMFQPYLPEYFESTNEGQLEIKKNTFRIEPGIYLTNSSVGNLRRVLLPGVAFLVDDKVNSSSQFNEYFKEIYRGSILCKNLVITLEEYKELIAKTLDDLLDAPISGKEFVNTIYALNKYRLISKEFVVQYTQKYREKNM